MCSRYSLLLLLLLWLLLAVRRSLSTEIALCFPNKRNWKACGEALSPSPALKTLTTLNREMTTIPMHTPSPRHLGSGFCFTLPFHDKAIHGQP
mmetsp:Transcript_27986/g.76377  ORF Transcript_27986/g.76377 Transcript_27986/m.76377 type:complete len:93 (-) Transcript_27986:840-1118(-)